MVGAIIAVLRLYQFIVIVRAAASWLPVDQRAGWFRLLVQLTEPVLAPIRSFARSGNFDLSPIVVIVIIELAIRALS